MKRRRIVAFALITLLSREAQATPLDDIKSASGLRSLNLAELQRGAIATNRGRLTGFSRGVYAESCYIIRASPARVAEMLATWDPTKHAELGVKISNEFRWPAEASAFSNLRLDANDRWIVDRTSTGKDADLYLPGSQREKLPAAAGNDQASAFWRGMLLESNTQISAAGLAALSPLKTVRGDISALNEFHSLLKMAPAVSKYFEPLLSRTPFRASGDSADTIVPWWEIATTRGHTSIHSGFVSAVRQPAESWQAADCTFYASDTFFFSVSLYQISAVDGGALIWQIDFVSAPFQSFAGSVARYFAQGEMLKDTAQTVRAFRNDIERSR